MKMIILNGPPRSGKDTFLKILKAVFMDDLPTDTLIPFSYKRVLCSEVAKRYNVSPQFIWDLNADTTKKDLPQEMFGGKSVRECLIYESEEVIKRQLGEDGVAIRTFQCIVDDHKDSGNVNDLQDCVLVTPDGGFASEMLAAQQFFGISRRDIFLIQFHRAGYTFEGDSRSYIPNPDMIVMNIEGDKVGLIDYLRHVQEFLGREEVLHGGELDTLYQLVMKGPLESGDMPSKSGFMGLVNKGLAFRDIDSFLGYATTRGIEKFKSLEWRDKLGSDILTKTQELKCQQDPKDFVDNVVVEERHTVKEKVPMAFRRHQL